MNKVDQTWEDSITYGLCIRFVSTTISPISFTNLYYFQIFEFCNWETIAFLYIILIEAIEPILTKKFIMRKHFFWLYPETKLRVRCMRWRQQTVWHRQAPPPPPSDSNVGVGLKKVFLGPTVCFSRPFSFLISTGWEREWTNSLRMEYLFFIAGKVVFVSVSLHHHRRRRRQGNRHPKEVIIVLCQVPLPNSYPRGNGARSTVILFASVLSSLCRCLISVLINCVLLIACLIEFAAASCPRYRNQCVP